jgi:hypothetical protein
MLITRCPHCHHATRLGVHFCTTCGGRLTPPITADAIAARHRTRQLARRRLPAACPWCRSPLSRPTPDILFCPACGAPLPLAA